MLPSTLKPYAKAVVAIATVVLTAAQTQIQMSATVHGWVTVALTALGALGVYAVPNKPAATAGPTRGVRR